MIFGMSIPSQATVHAMAAALPQPTTRDVARATPQGQLTAAQRAALTPADYGMPPDLLDQIARGNIVLTHPGDIEAASQAAAQPAYDDGRRKGRTEGAIIAGLTGLAVGGLVTWALMRRRPART